MGGRKTIQQRENVEFSFFVFPILSKSHMSWPSSVATVTFFCNSLHCERAATSRRPPLRLGNDRVGQRLEGPRARWVAPGRTKGALVGAHEEYMRSQGVVPGRWTKGSLGGALEDDLKRSR